MAAGAAPPGPTPALYRPRRPSESPLYRFVVDHLDTLVQFHEEELQLDTVACAVSPSALRIKYYALLRTSDGCANATRELCPSTEGSRNVHRGTQAGRFESVVSSPLTPSSNAP